LIHGRGAPLWVAAVIAMKSVEKNQFPHHIQIFQASLVKE
jgi:hypothetical protein